MGKTTLAQVLAARVEAQEVIRFDLENSRHVRRLEDPMFALEGLGGLVILDEIQLRPELFPVLRVLADRPGPPARFLVLGSASPDLLRQAAPTPRCKSRDPLNASRARGARLCVQNGAQ